MLRFFLVRLVAAAIAVAVFVLVMLAAARSAHGAEPPPAKASPRPGAAACRVFHGAWVQKVDARGRTVLTRPTRVVCSSSSVGPAPVAPR